MNAIGRRSFVGAAAAALRGGSADRISVGMIGTSHSHAAGKLKVFVGSPDLDRKSTRLNSSHT